MNLKRKHIILFAVVAMIAIAGCSSTQTAENDDGGEDLANDTGVEVGETKSDNSYDYEVKITEKNQNKLVRAQPPQVMEHSLERQNLINRYEYLNDENNVHHVYLIDEGQVVGYYVAQGKVSSVNSKLTNDKQIVKVDRAHFDKRRGAGGGSGVNYKTVESPQMDGSYGENGDSIFFFTTSGDYVESSLDYVVSEEPKNIQDEVLLVDQPEDNSDDDSDNSSDS